MKKIILTEDQYKKVDNFVNEQLSDNRYYMDVNVDVYYKGKISDIVEDVVAPKIKVSYLIEAEYRHWGIKSINLRDIKGPESIDLEVSYYLPNDNFQSETKTVTVPLDWEMVEMDDEKGMGVVCVDHEITLHVTENAHDELYCPRIIVPIKTL